MSFFGFRYGVFFSSLALVLFALPLSGQKTKGAKATEGVKPAVVADTTDIAAMHFNLREAVVTATVINGDGTSVKNTITFNCDLTPLEKFFSAFVRAYIAIAKLFEKSILSL